MRGSDIPPPPGYRPTPLATLGQQLVQACGVDLRICDTNKESRS